MDDLQSDQGSFLRYLWVTKNNWLAKGPTSYLPIAYMYTCWCFKKNLHNFFIFSLTLLFVTLSPSFTFSLNYHWKNSLLQDFFKCFDFSEFCHGKVDELRIEYKPATTTKTVKTCNNLILFTKLGLDHTYINDLVLTAILGGDAVQGSRTNQLFP